MNKPIPLARLGNSGLVVSRLALGTMMFGDRTDEAEARRIFDEATDLGMNFIDTADSYADGRSEQITGKFLNGARDRYVLATKIANAGGSGPNERGLSRKWMFARVDHCLKNIGTDFIDILYLHKEDPGTPLEETLRAVADLQRSGKIRYFGVSNFRAWRVARICALCDEAGIDRPIANQILYHALNRLAEIEQFPVSAHHGIGTVIYSPLARGVLSGKYAPDTAPPAGSRAALKNPRILQTEYHADNLRAANAIAAHAARRGIDPTAFAIAWSLANPLTTAVLPGPRTLDQWRSYLGALAVEITAEDENFVNELVPAGTTAIPRYVDPAYPVEGRPAP